MSSSDLALPVRVAIPRTGGRSRFISSEIGLVFRRRRNIAMLVVLIAAPILIGIAVRTSAPSRQDSADGPAFIGQIAGNGLFLGFTALVVTLPFFIPLAVSVVSGDAVAGEASAGTLRYLLTVPVGRTRLLAVKYLAIVTYGAVAAALVVTVGIIVGAILFPIGPATLLSGDTISFGATLFRALLVAGYVGIMLATVGAIGLFISTLTEVPVGAMAATAGLTIITEILDAIPQLSWLHEWLFTHWWLSFGDLLRDPVRYADIQRGLISAAVYILVFLSLAWARLTTKDVTS
jgi:ABC-2 type transport system permease protein